MEHIHDNVYVAINAVFFGESLGFQTAHAKWLSGSNFI